MQCKLFLVLTDILLTRIALCFRLRFSYCIFRLPSVHYEIDLIIKAQECIIQLKTIPHYGQNSVIENGKRNIFICLYMKSATYAEYQRYMEIKRLKEKIRYQIATYILRVPK